MSISNAPLPDQLAEIRAELKRLEEREATLRGELLAHPELRTGAAWIAEVKNVVTRRTDWKELAACHPSIVEQYTFPVPVERVVLSGVDEETGEIISARQKRAAQETAQ